MFQQMWIACTAWSKRFVNFGFSQHTCWCCCSPEWQLPCCVWQSLHQSVSQKQWIRVVTFFSFWIEHTSGHGCGVQKNWSSTICLPCWKAPCMTDLQTNVPSPAQPNEGWCSLSQKSTFVVIVFWWWVGVSHQTKMAFNICWKTDKTNVFHSLCPLFVCHVLIWLDPAMFTKMGIGFVVWNLHQDGAFKIITADLSGSATARHAISYWLKSLSLTFPTCVTSVLSLQLNTLATCQSTMRQKTLCCNCYEGANCCEIK